MEPTFCVETLKYEITVLAETTTPQLMEYAFILTFCGIT
jgi:hypothetical protein